MLEKDKDHIKNGILKKKSKPKKQTQTWRTPCWLPEAAGWAE